MLRNIFDLTKFKHWRFFDMKNLPVDITPVDSSECFYEVFFVFLSLIRDKWFPFFSLETHRNNEF